MTPKVRRCSRGIYHAVVRSERSRPFVALIEKRQGRWWLETEGLRSFATLGELQRFLGSRYHHAEETPSAPCCTRNREKERRMAKALAFWGRAA